MAQSVFQDTGADLRRSDILMRSHACIENFQPGILLQASLSVNYTPFSPLDTNTLQICCSIRPNSIVSVNNYSTFSVHCIRAHLHLSHIQLLLIVNAHVRSVVFIEVEKPYGVSFTRSMPPRRLREPCEIVSRDFRELPGGGSLRNVFSPASGASYRYENCQKV
jgi:hypothetical protein